MDFFEMQIRIDVTTQTLEWVVGGEVVRCSAISTSRYGLGTEEGSQRTPTGEFVIAEKHGEGAGLGEILVSRVATGRVGEEGDDRDHVQTRILWLSGLGEENANTYGRYIYIHGTNAESKLGTAASCGCVRMGNEEVRDLFERVEVGTRVEIVGGEGGEGAR